MKPAPNIDDLISLFNANGFNIDLDLRHNIHLLALATNDAPYDTLSNWGQRFVRHLECLIVKAPVEQNRFARATEDWLKAHAFESASQSSGMPALPLNATSRWSKKFFGARALVFLSAILALTVLTLAGVTVWNISQNPASTFDPGRGTGGSTSTTPGPRPKEPRKFADVDAIVDEVVSAAIEYDRAPTLRELHARGAFGAAGLLQVTRVTGFPVDQPLAMDDPLIPRTVLSSAVWLRMGREVDFKSYEARIASLLSPLEDVFIPPEDAFINRGAGPLYRVLSFESSGPGYNGGQSIEVARVKLPVSFWKELFGSISFPSKKELIGLGRPKKMIELSRTILLSASPEIDVINLATENFATEIKLIWRSDLNAGTTSRGQILVLDPWVGKRGVYPEVGFRISHESLARSFSAYSFSIGRGVVFTDGDWLPEAARRDAPPFNGWLPYLHWVLSLATAAAAVGFWIWRAARMQGWLDRHRGGESHILDLRGEAMLDTSLAFPGVRQVARALLKPFRSELVLDVPKSVKASVAAGGLLTPLQKPRFSTLSTLMLIDQRSVDDHGARRALDWHHRLVGENVPVTAYVFEGGPDWVRPLRGGRALRLQEIASRHAGDKLLICGSASDFISAGTSALGVWREGLQAFPYRALLTSVPASEWGFGEDIVQCEGGLRAYPMTQNGMIAALAGFETEQSLTSRDASTKAASWIWPACLYDEPGRWLEEFPPSQEDVRLLISQLHGWLGSQGMRWLSACAVYPVLDWDLTLQLGAKLGAGPHGLVTEDRLLRLTHLPWLRQGHLPNWLRSALIDEIQPDDHDLIVIYLHELVQGLEDDTVASGLHLRFAAAIGRDAAKDERFVTFATKPLKGGDPRALEATRALAKLLRPSLLQRLTNPAALASLTSGLVFAGLVWVLAPRLGLYGETSEFWWAPVAVAAVGYLALSAGYKAVVWLRARVRGWFKGVGSHDPTEKVAAKGDDVFTEGHGSQSAQAGSNGLDVSAEVGEPAPVRVFISHALADRSAAQTIGRVLGAMRGVRVIESASTPISSSFSGKNINALADADVIIVLWSKASVDSAFVLEEAKFGLKSAALVQCVIGDNVEIPPRFVTDPLIEMQRGELSDKAKLRKIVERIATSVVRASGRLPNQRLESERT